MTTESGTPMGAYSKIMRDPDVALFDQYQPDLEWTRPERYAGWDVAEWCRLGVYEDRDGLHLTVSTRDKDYTRSVTPEQVEAFAHNLLALNRAMRKYPSETVASDDLPAQGGAE